MPTKDPQKIKEKNARYDAKRQGRTRNFATVVYPESAPEGWIAILDEYHLASLISPLHEYDTNPSGEVKKAHHHVLVMFESPTEWDKVKPIFDSIGGVGKEHVNSCRGYARYLCHLDNPEKHQYAITDVIALGGADYIGITSLPTDDIKMLADVFAYIRENEVFSLAELLDATAVHHPEWFSMIAMSRGYIVDKYIKSLAWEREVGYRRKTESNDNVENLGTSCTGDVES